MMKFDQTASIYHWASCCWLVLALGCGSKPAPAIPDSSTTVEGGATSAQGDNPQPTGLAAPLETASTTSGVAKLPPAIPSDDRYAPSKLAATNHIDLKPWTGPRPELPVTATTLEQFQAAWQIDLEISEEPLAKVIETIVSGVPGWQPQLLVATDAENAGAAVALSGALEKPISLKLNKVSRLEAIERACEAAGVYPEYAHEREFAAHSKPIIRLHAGPRSSKFGLNDANLRSQLVVFAGPQMIEVTGIKEFPPYAVGSLGLKMVSLPFPSSVRNLLESPACTFERAILTDGRDVLAALAGNTRVIVPTLLEVRNDRLQLKDLLKEDKLLAEVQGVVRLPIPLQTSVIWLDSLAEGYRTENEQLTARLLTNSVTPGSWYLRYEVISGNSLEGLVAFAYDAEGQLIPTDSFGTSWAPGFNQGTGSLNLSTEPRMLAIVVIDKLTSFDSEFTLTNIPLKKYEEQPAKLPSLSLGKFEEPLSISVGELKRETIFKQIELTMSNRTNKDIREFEFTMHYLDAQGNKLRDNPTSIAARYDDAKEPYPILIKAGTTTKMMQTAYLCPEETQRVTITVTSILFADLDRWSPDSAR